MQTAYKGNLGVAQADLRGREQVKTSKTSAEKICEGFLFLKRGSK